MRTIQQIIRSKSQQAVSRTRRDSEHIAGLMIRKGVKDFKVIKEKGRKIKSYGLKF